MTSKVFKNGFQNRKWNYFSHFLTSDQKTYFTICFSFVPRDSKLIFKTGNGIIQTGNGIISPTSRPLIKKLLLQKFSHFHQGVPNRFSKQETEKSKQEMEWLISLPALWSKTSSTRCFTFFQRSFKLIFKTGDGNI